MSFSHRHSHLVLQSYEPPPTNTSRQANHPTAAATARRSTSSSSGCYQSSTRGRQRLLRLPYVQKALDDNKKKGEKDTQNSHKKILSFSFLFFSFLFLKTYHST
jgi:hypothetical protein